MHNLEIISEKEYPINGAKKFWISVDHPGKQTPSRHEIFAEIVKKLSSNDESTVIDKIFSERGSAKSRVKVMVYKEKAEIPKAKSARHERKVRKYMEKRSAKAASVQPAGAAEPKAGGA